VAVGGQPPGCGDDDHGRRRDMWVMAVLEGAAHETSGGSPAMTVSAFATIQQSASTASPQRSDTIIRHAAIGGVVGAAAAAGLSFTALPFIGGVGAPIAAAIGGAVGIVVGGIIGLLRSGGSSEDARAAGVSVARQLPPPPPGTTGTGLPPALPR
jgi:NAD/NADP transhydrogenase beta subunit